MTGALAALMQPIIDEVFQAKSERSLVLVASAVFTSFALRGFASYMQAVLMNDVGQRIVATAQNQLYSHLIRMDLSYLHANASGQLLSRVINDVQVMRLAVGECLAGMGSSSLTLIILIALCSGATGCWPPSLSLRFLWQLISWRALASGCAGCGDKRKKRWPSSPP